MGDRTGGAAERLRRALPTEIPAHAVELLRREGVVTLLDWRSRGAARLNIFGLPRRVAKQLDRLARTALR